MCDISPKCFFVVFVFVFTRLPQATIFKNINSSRIIDGKPAAPGQFAWQVGILQHEDEISYCGGTLICDNWVLTTAHCVLGESHVVVYLGSVNENRPSEPGRVLVESSQIIVHEKYDQKFLHNDVALIRLRLKVTFNDKIRAIPLGAHQVDADAMVTVSGWGFTSEDSGTSEVLNYVDLRTITNQECAKVFGPNLRPENVCCKVNPHHSSCYGDSGGPLVQKQSNGQYIHVGIVSFGSNKGCQLGYPSVFARTSSFLNWIKQRIGETCQLP